MTRSLVTLASALALIIGVSCRRQTGSENRDTTRTARDAGIANGNGPGAAVAGRDRGCININTASADELRLLPGIGPSFAGKIIDYRNKYGRFERPEDIIIIDGFGERRYHKIERYICTN
jgi:competence protein ComEA